MTKKSINPLAVRIVDLLLDDLCGRSGLGDEFDMVDNEVQLEIEHTWQRIVSEALSV